MSVALPAWLVGAGAAGGTAAAAGGVAAAAGGVAAAGAATAGLGAAFWGPVLSGIGSAAMSYMSSREEEKRMNREQDRRTASYAGAGQAIRFWENSTAPGGQRVGDLAQRAAEAPKLNARPDKLGQRHRKRAEAAAAPRPEYKFDRDRREVVRI